MSLVRAYTGFMQQRKVGKRFLARRSKERQAVGVTFALTAAPLVGIGTLLFPGVGTIAGLLCAGAIATVRSRRMTTTH